MDREILNIARSADLRAVYIERERERSTIYVRIAPSVPTTSLLTAGADECSSTLSKCTPSRPHIFAPRSTPDTQPARPRRDQTLNLESIFRRYGTPRLAQRFAPEQSPLWGFGKRARCERSAASGTIAAATGIDKGTARRSDDSTLSRHLPRKLSPDRCWTLPR